MAAWWRRHLGPPAGTARHVAEPGTASSVCRCGHRLEAHLHYRAGRDCALCPAKACPGYRVRRRWSLIG